MDTSGLPARQLVRNVERARAVHELWVSFISDDQPSLANGANWPTYTSAHPNVVHIREDDMVIELDPFGARAALWAV